MDIDSWFWLVAGFWVGAIVGFVACAMLKAGRGADMRRGQALRIVHPDLLSDTTTLY